MDHYELEYGGHFLDIRLRQLSRGGGPSEYWAEVRVTAARAGAPTCQWTTLKGEEETFTSTGEALQEGMTRGVAYVDKLLEG